MQANVKQSVQIRSGISPDQDITSLLQQNKPIVLKGLVKDWPVVQASKQGFESFADYLSGFDQGATVNLSVGSADIDGRLFYNDAYTGLNVAASRVPFQEVLGRLYAAQHQTNPPLVYMGSTTAEACLPHFTDDNPLTVPHNDPLISLWLGNQSRIAAHYDVPDNLACVAGGRRKFTLFPPDQIDNLYIGPLDFTPAGQAVSMVDFHNIDQQKYPKFQKALDHAQVAELEAGDAIYIPSMWWHHVEGTDSFNLLVNYWWRQAESFMGPPAAAFEHAILAIRDLPQHEKDHWQSLFQHYIFGDQNGKYDHIPTAIKGQLSPLNEISARRLRATLLQKINR